MDINVQIGSLQQAMLTKKRKFSPWKVIIVLLCSYMASSGVLSPVLGAVCLEIQEMVFRRIPW